MRHACTSPGSRCTPIVLSLVREKRICCFSHIDERCAGFFALGAAKASGRPVAVTCTSGTATANLAPAVIEAHQARRSPDRAHRRPTTRATRGGSRPDDRPAQAVRRCGQVVLRCRSPGRRGRSLAMDADACMQGVLDGARGPAGPGPSQLPVARATRRPRPPTRRPRARTPRRHTVGASRAGSVHSCAGTRPTPFGKDCRRRGRRDRQSGGLGELLCSEADSVARRPALGGTTGPSRDRPLRPYPA